MATQLHTAERMIGRIAARAHGVVTRAELLAAGLTSDEIGERVRKGLLIPQYRGVYRVGHRAPSTEATYMAAVKACGEGAVLGGHAAGWLLGMVKGKPPRPTVIALTQRRIPNLLTRRCKGLDRRDVMKKNGIALTTPARTIVDLAATMPLDDLARACHEAGVRYRTTPRQVEAVLGRKSNASGAAKLREVMYGKPKVALSRLEDRAFELIVAADLPRPETNRSADNRRVDLRWPGKLTVELLSYTHHGSRHAWEKDQRRQREARARDEDFRTFTWDDFFVTPDATIAELRAALRDPG